mgnify:CR=1 FL=1
MPRRDKADSRDDRPAGQRPRGGHHAAAEREVRAVLLERSVGRHAVPLDQERRHVVLHAFLGVGQHRAQVCPHGAEGVLLGLGQRGEVRFRSFLLRCFTNWLVNEHQRNGAAKRGGGAAFLSIDDMGSHMNEPALIEGQSPDTAYDQRWARTLVEQYHLVDGLFQLRVRATSPFIGSGSPTIQGSPNWGSPGGDVSRGSFGGGYGGGGGRSSY